MTSFAAAMDATAPRKPSRRTGSSSQRYEAHDAATVTAKLGAPFDNRHPREWLARQSGWRARANAAQLNGFEAFPLVEVALLHVAARWIAQQLTDGGRVDRDPDRTAQRAFKLIAKNTARLMGYASSDACLFAFPRSLSELDATPENFCEPDLSALVAAGIARSPQ